MQTIENDPYKDMKPGEGLIVVGNRRNPPNTPCACGSGRKQKKCHYHGAPVYGPGVEPKPVKTKPSMVAGLAASTIMILGSER